ncbi:MAG: RagB/SusD family nutrient uptake outer membrane protein [Gilvibacter sp.]
MKKFIYTILIFISLQGCNDALDILPVDAVAAEGALTTPEDIDLALSGAYAAYNPQLLIQFSSRFADDLRFGNANGGQGTVEHNQTINAGSGVVANIYSSYYAVINRVNRILEATELLDQSGLTADQKDRLKEIEGQAYALRGLAHFDLLSFFAPSFQNSDLGIPYIDFVVILELPARNSVGEVFAGILSDLDAAKGLISESATIFLTKDFITALEAKIALYRGDNSSAITKANALISAYNLGSRTQYESMYQDADDTEVIFKLSRTVSDARAGGLFYFTGTGGAFFEMSFGLFSELDPADVRYDVLVDDDIDGGTIDPVSDPPTTIFIKKYPGRDGQFGLNDLKLYRIAEQYLIKAEAQAKQGQLAEAALTIDALRDARFGADMPTPVYGSLLEAINDVLAERRIELAYEGHRYIDLRRTRDITGLGIVRNEADCGGPTPCLLLPTDFKFTLPIPQAEIDVNPNMVQNPGYDTN